MPADILRENVKTILASLFAAGPAAMVFCAL